VETTTNIMQDMEHRIMNLGEEEKGVKFVIPGSGSWIPALVFFPPDSCLLTPVSFF
jgi:hypothetical protein